MPSGPPPAPGAPPPPGGRPFLGVKFACCNVYYRIYQNAKGTAYAGHCPRCRKPVEFPIGTGGTTTRFFIVY